MDSQDRGASYHRIGTRPMHDADCYGMTNSSLEEGVPSFSVVTHRTPPKMLNYSYHILVLIILQAFLITPRIAIARLGFIDNVHPRQALDKMEKLGKWDQKVIRRLRRRQAAHENCLESLGVICAAIVAGNTAGLGGSWMTGAAGTYFVLRCIFSELS